MAKKGCSKCGNEFEARGNRSKYCSIKCQYGIGVCRTCGKEFVKKSYTTGVTVLVDVGITLKTSRMLNTRNVLIVE